jgi:hypothetical protein
MDSRTGLAAARPQLTGATAVWVRRSTFETICHRDTMTRLVAMPFLALLADPAPDAHRFRIHADVQPVGVLLHGRPGYRNTEADLGLPGSAASLGFGFAPHPMVLVGARLRGSLRVTHSEAVDADQRSVGGSIGLLPYVEVRPLPHLRVQPFVLVEGGVAYEGWRFRTTPYGRATDQQLTPSVGTRVGMHAFVLPRVSIDADVGVGHQWTGSFGRGVSRNWWSAWTVTGTFGVSGWF